MDILLYVAFAIFGFFAGVAVMFGKVTAVKADVDAVTQDLTRQFELMRSKAVINEQEKTVTEARYKNACKAVEQLQLRLADALALVPAIPQDLQGMSKSKPAPMGKAARSGAKRARRRTNSKARPFDVATHQLP